ncbi:MAG: iron-sulfur cluster assembly scaffold protein [Gammaproteobacteria bacterium]|jgi:nitrogen fixation NifU-like protein|nr:iron-sulfur cluster assembly scaffold protein [Gammaproteobacteria bacterium]
MANDLKDLYQKTMIEHGNNPLNFGKPKEYKYSEEGFNALCGDKINIFINKTKSNEIKFSFVSIGCIICKASASLMTNELNNKSLETTETCIDNFLVGIANGQLNEDLFSYELMALNQINKFPSRLKCALLPWETTTKLLKKINKDD